MDEETTLRCANCGRVLDHNVSDDKRVCRDCSAKLACAYKKPMQLKKDNDDKTRIRINCLR